jgi:hypothetical protein
MTPTFDALHKPLWPLEHVLSEHWNYWAQKSLNTCATPVNCD